MIHIYIYCIYIYLHYDTCFLNIFSNNLPGAGAPTAERGSKPNAPCHGGGRQGPRDRCRWTGARFGIFIDVQQWGCGFSAANSNFLAYFWDILEQYFNIFSAIRPTLSWSSKTSGVGHLMCLLATAHPAIQAFWLVIFQPKNVISTYHIAFLWPTNLNDNFVCFFSLVLWCLVILLFHSPSKLGNFLPRLPSRHLCHSSRRNRRDSRDTKFHHGRFRRSMGSEGWSPIRFSAKKPWFRVDSTSKQMKRS